MANFKVGDRVRLRKDADPVSPEAQPYLGQETVIIGRAKIFEWKLALRFPNGQHICAESQALEPLVPPAANTWAADKVKQVTKPQHLEPVRENTLLPIWP